MPPGSPSLFAEVPSQPTQVPRWLLIAGPSAVMSPPVPVLVRVSVPPGDTWRTVVLMALPTDMFYNTGIATYIWVLSNRKTPQRQGKVQLIDARNHWVPMEKSLGNKRNRFLPQHISEIVSMYEGFSDAERVEDPGRVDQLGRIIQFVLDHPIVPKIMRLYSQANVWLQGWLDYNRNGVFDEPSIF